MTETRRGVAAVIGSSVAIFWTGGFIFGLPGLLGPFWQELFHVGRGAVGNILFFVLAAVGFFMFFVGRWQERYGTRLMIALAAVMTGLDMVLLAYASNVFMLYVWAFVMGAASCFVYIPALTTVQRWFPARRGVVSGVVNLMFGMAAAVMAPACGFLLDAVGYVVMNWSLGIASLVVGLLAAWFTEVPERVLPGGGAPAAAVPAPAFGRSLTVRESVRTSSFWFLWCTWALQGAAGIAMVTLSVGFGLSRGYGLETAVLLLTSFSAANGVSRLASGFLSDIIGRNATMSMTFFPAGAAYFLLPHVSDFAVQAILCGVIGFAFGTLFGVSAPLATDCFGMRHFGAIFGLVFTAYGFVAGIIGPSLSGYLLDAYGGNYVIVFGYLGVFCLISGVLIRYVIPPQSPSPALE